MKITKRQLRQIILEEKKKLMIESQDASLLPLALEAINDGTAKATMGLGLGPDEIIINFGRGQAVVLKLRGF